MYKRHEELSGGRHGSCQLPSRTNSLHFCGEVDIPAIGYVLSLEGLTHVRGDYIEIDQLVKSYCNFQCILGRLTR